MRKIRSLFCAIAITSIPIQPSAEPLFYSSVNSNDFEFIRADDPTALDCIVLRKRDRREMPSKATDELFADDVFIFEARYTDGRPLELWAHSDFQTEQRALATVFEVAKSVGRLPTAMRRRLDHVVVHTGDFTANAEDLGHFFMVYEQNVAKRLSTHDLDETVFHESVHATLDIPHSSSKEWRIAQRRDGTHITGYAAKKPNGEDLAETALFAYALFKFPGRLPAEIENQVRETIPHRLELLRGVIPTETAQKGRAAFDCR